MVGDLANILLDFETDFLDQPSNNNVSSSTTSGTVAQNLLFERSTKDEKKKKTLRNTLFFIKSKVNKTDALIQKYLEKCDVLAETEKKLECSRRECQEARIDAEKMELLKDDFQKNFENLQKEFKKLEHKVIDTDNKQEASQCYIKQLQSLLKKRDKESEGLMLEKNKQSDTIKFLEKRIVALQKNKDELDTHLRNVADVVFTKRNLNRKEKIFLAKMMRLKVQDDRKRREKGHSEENIENGKFYEGNDTEEINIDTETYEDNLEEVISGSNEVHIEGETIACKGDLSESNEDACKSNLTSYLMAENKKKVSSPDTSKDNCLELEMNCETPEDNFHDFESLSLDTGFGSPGLSLQSPTSTISTKTKDVGVYHKPQTEDRATSPIEFVFKSPSRQDKKRNSPKMVDKALSPVKELLQPAKEVGTYNFGTIPDIVINGKELQSPALEFTNMELDKEVLVDDSLNNNEVEMILNNMRLPGQFVTPIPPSPTKGHCEGCSQATSMLPLLYEEFISLKMLTMEQLNQYYIKKKHSPVVQSSENVTSNEIMESPQICDIQSTHIVVEKHVQKPKSGNKKTIDERVHIHNESHKDVLRSPIKQRSYKPNNSLAEQPSKHTIVEESSFQTDDSQADVKRVSKSKSKGLASKKVKIRNDTHEDAHENSVMRTNHHRTEQNNSSEEHSREQIIDNESPSRVNVWQPDNSRLTQKVLGEIAPLCDKSYENAPINLGTTRLIDNLKFQESEEPNNVDNLIDDISPDGHAKEVASESNKVLKSKKLTRLEKYRQKLIPKGKIRKADSPPPRKLRSGMKPVSVRNISHIDKNIDAMEMKIKSARERAAKVMSDLNLNKSTSLVPNLPVCRRKTRNQNEETILENCVDRNSVQKVSDDKPILNKPVKRKYSIESYVKNSSVCELQHDNQPSKSAKTTFLAKTQTKFPSMFFDKDICVVLERFVIDKQVDTGNILKRKLDSPSMEKRQKQEPDKRILRSAIRGFNEAENANAGSHNSSESYDSGTKILKSNLDENITLPKSRSNRSASRNTNPNNSASSSSPDDLEGAASRNTNSKSSSAAPSLPDFNKPTSLNDKCNQSPASPLPNFKETASRNTNFKNISPALVQPDITGLSSQNTNSKTKPSILDGKPRESVNYDDIDCFTDSPPVKKQKQQEANDANETGLSALSGRPQDSILCKMIEKYGATRKIKQKKNLGDVGKTIGKQIEENIAKINELPINETKGELMSMVEEMQKLEKEAFLCGLMAYLCSPARKLELYARHAHHTPHAPALTRSEQVVLYLVTRLQWAGAGGGAGGDTPRAVLARIEYALFRLNNTPELDVVESLAHLYAVLCRYLKAKTRLRVFMLDAMYCIQFKAIPLIRQCIDVWMHVLPLSHMGIAKSPLVTCLVYLLHFFKCEDRNNRVQEIRQILQKKYFYSITQWSEQNILEMVKSAILELKENDADKKMLRLTIILLAKRHGAKWCENKIIKGLLRPIITTKSIPDHVRAFCVSMMGPLHRPYPAEMKVYCEITLNQLVDMLETNQPPIMQEAIYLSLIVMSRHNKYRVIQALLAWKPQQISINIENAMKCFILEKKVKEWKQIVCNAVNED